MTTTESITALNELIEINNDRVEGYKTAMKETSDPDLKRTFAELSVTSEQNLAELLKAMHSLGGTPEEGTRTDGKLYRAWMDIKAALTGGSRHQILSSCEYGEDMALDTYEHVLEHHVKEMTSEHADLVRSQKSRLQQDHDKVKAMRDAE